MKNIDKLHKLYARVPGSLLHVAIHGYDYVCKKSGEVKRGRLQSVDFEIYMMLYLHSDMRRRDKGGTLKSHPVSAKKLSDASRPAQGERPRWSVRTVQYSLRRLKDAGFLTEVWRPNQEEILRVGDPYYVPSRAQRADEEGRRAKAAFDDISS